MLVARAVVMPGEIVPVCLMNPTGGSINLYSGASVAVLSEVAEVMNDQPKKCDIVENTVVVSAVNDDSGSAPLEEMLMELVKDTSLSSHHQDLLLTLLIDYSDIFARSKDELGHTDVLQHEIITDGAPPIRQRFRRLSPERREEMRIMLNDMLNKLMLQYLKTRHCKYYALVIMIQYYSVNRNIPQLCPVLQGYVFLRDACFPHTYH